MKDGDGRQEEVVTLSFSLKYMHDMWKVNC